MAAAPGEVTQLLGKVRQGDREAEPRLMDLVYRELHRLAVSFMRRERPDHTLQPTALVNEAYLQMMGNEHLEIADRNHFLALAAQLMRRILIDHARSLRAEKRQGARVRVDFETIDLFSPARSEELLAVDEALTRLAQWDSRQSQVVELRFFGGLTEEEVAQLLGIAPRTVRREWSMARTWLHAELTEGKSSDTGEMGAH